MLLVMSDFRDVEGECTSVFDQLGSCWHVWSPEDFEIIFRNDDDFRDGMGLMGVVSKMFPDIIVLTYELMSNHLHVCAAGEELRLRLMMETLKRFLKRRFEAKGYTLDWSRFVFGIRKLESLSDVRNVCVYDNRNGFLVHEEFTPLTYPWGANAFFFNPFLCRVVLNDTRDFSQRQCRLLTSSKKADSVKGLLMYEDCVLPLSFCRIDLAERLFRSASHYFYMLGKNLESNLKIASELKERIFYTDDELFSAVCKICASKYGIGVPSQIPAEAKTEMAKLMHFDYNASNKQIQRMLRLERDVVAAMFVKPSV